MAGSYNHIIDDEGNFLTNDEFVGMIENLGDAYEMAEEMYGMIWYLAAVAAPATADSQKRETIVANLVESARLKYLEGLKVARNNVHKEKH